MGYNWAFKSPSYFLPVPNQMLSELYDILVKHNAKWMIWEATPLSETVAKLERQGITSIVFAHCSNRPMSGDYLSVMQENIGLLRIIHAN